MGVKISSSFIFFCHFLLKIHNFSVEFLKICLLAFSPVFTVFFEAKGFFNCGRKNPEIPAV